MPVDRLGSTKQKLRVHGATSCNCNEFLIGIDQPLKRSLKPNITSLYKHCEIANDS